MQESTSPSPPPSPAETPVPRWLRLAELTPVLAALGVHAVAHGRWALSAPVGLALVLAAGAGVRVAYSQAKLLGGAVPGLGAGLLLLWVSEPPIGPFPPSLLSPLCGLLVGIAAVCALCRNRLYAWTYSGLLVALSLSTPLLGGLVWALAALGLSLLLMAFVEGGLVRTGRAGAVGFLGFALLLGLLGLPLVRTIHASEGVLMDAIFRLTQQQPRGMQLQSQLDLQAVSRLSQGSSRALLVLAGGRPERLRTQVFDTFDGQRWTASQALVASRLELPAGESARALAMTVLTPLGTQLPAPAGTRAVEGAQARVEGGWVLRAEELQGSTVALRLGAEERMLEEGPPGESLLAVPEALAAELRPLAEALTREARTPREKARALERYFQGQFTYSLSVDLRGEGSPLAVLVREKRAAYCTYFASAMAAMLRMVGVPARVVGGFAPVEQNPLTGATLVRERDAHAWVEVYLAEEGRFEAFDPTPWQSRDEALGVDSGPPGWVASAAGAVMVWLRGLAALVRYQPLELVRGLERSPLFWLTLGAFAVWQFRGVRRRRQGPTQRTAMKARDETLAAAYARYLRTLKRGAGLVPGPSETDDELLARLRATRGEAAVEVATEFLSHYREARYRGELASAPQWSALVDRLEARLRAEPG
jgi:hypothetical protein